MIKLLYQVQSRRISNEKLRHLHELLAKNTQITNNYSPFDWILVGKPELRSFSTKKSKTTKRTKLETRAIFFGKDFSPTVRDKQRGVGVLTSWYCGPLMILLVAGMRAFPKHAGICNEWSIIRITSCDAGCTFGQENNWVWKMKSCWFS